MLTGLVTSASCTFKLSSILISSRLRLSWLIWHCQQLSHTCICDCQAYKDRACKGMVLSVCDALQVSHQLGRPLNRKFKSPRKIEFREQGWGLNIAPPPEPRPPKVRIPYEPRNLFLSSGCCLYICPVSKSKDGLQISFAAFFKGSIV